MGALDAHTGFKACVFFIYLNEIDEDLLFYMWNYDGRNENKDIY